MAFQSNPQLDIAFEYVHYTNKNIFLTGKAGTGKTTFLHKIKTETHKRMAIVAPTGVAAINAGGVTIHSLFQLPFGAYLPGNTKDFARQRKFGKDKIRLIQSLDLLVIDEISMVRADMLDAVDDVLRRFKDHYKPFGGVQLLMIGDLHQLPPVVKEEEWEELRQHYETAYFFSSHALQKTDPVAIELKHIYRQSDTYFIDLLNKVRNNRLDSQVLAALNSRYIPNFQPREDENYITLSSHNLTAQNINSEKLEALDGTVQRFTAKVEGDFPTFSYPTDAEIDLKVNAQVMFVKNDISPEKKYYNGKIGKIIKIYDGAIYVQCPNEMDQIVVSQVEWKNVKYTLDEASKEVREETIGTFTQYPLKLAWAITIHKSQGLTFERAVIDANAAFAHGQVYVALSRCKTFEGIVLRSKIDNFSVRTDTVVRNYSEKIDQNAPNQADLSISKQTFQQGLIVELFDFSILKRFLEQTQRALLENDKIINASAIQSFETFWGELELSVLTIAEKFKPQIYAYFNQTALPEENEALQARIQKASIYFQEKIKEKFLKDVVGILVESDNKTVKKTIVEALENVEKNLFLKNSCFAACIEKFSGNSYLRAKNNAELDFKTAKMLETVLTKPASLAIKDSEHPELYIRLKQWRDNTAANMEAEHYMILPSKVLLDLTNILPINEAELKQVKGIGAAKLKAFGLEIVKIIADYVQEKNISRPQLTIEAFTKPAKIDTKQVSLDLYKAGKTLEEIATERGFVVTTIEGHLTPFIEKGEVSVFDLLSKADVDTIGVYFDEHELRTAPGMFAYFDGKYSYGQMKMVLAHKVFLASKEGEM
ncbi:MAG: hypothetical protein RLZZ292_943 [Bacteroidota bacterium]|jgi:hypothetical protein